MREKFQKTETIKKILKNSNTLAVVGLSPKPHRASHSVSAFLKSKGYKIIPVYPREQKILGEPVYRSLSEIEDIIDTVIIFRRSEYVKPIVEEAIEVKANAIWMQEGVIDESAGNLAQENGIDVVIDLCMYKEYIKYM